MYGTAWKKEATARLVQEAVGAGFTAIDTANQLIHYQEAMVGEALLALAKQGTSRDRLFLQTKFTSANGQDHRTPYDPKADLTTQVTQSFDSSLDHLHTDYIDSYVLHGPQDRRGLGAEDWEIWTAIETIYDSGRAKLIGVSNVSAEQLTLLCGRARHRPMVVQNRCYAALGWDQEVRAICRTHRIIYQGFSLLTANRELFAKPEVRAMASKYGMGLAQLIFRFAMQIGMLPLTGTTNPQHMREDLQSDRFTIDSGDLQRLETIAT
jgi:diketogulonate reductase-like aldo/keto reductase